MKSKSDIPEAVFRVWRLRERIELEAADQFSRLSGPLRPLAERACTDEKRHAVLCRKILDQSPVALEAYTPDVGTLLGPADLTEAQRTLYASVALGCVTESLSTALLVSMLKKARPGIYRDTVHEILEDEVAHSRLGWAELARVAAQESVAWLVPHLPGMLREAMESDLRPVLKKQESGLDLSEFGILPPAVTRDVMRQTVKEVILPGFERLLH